MQLDQPRSGSGDLMPRRDSVPRPRSPLDAAPDQPESRDLPIVVVITADPVARQDVIRRMDGSAAIMLAPDAETARRMLHGPSAGAPTRSEEGLLAELIVDERRQRVTWDGTPLDLTPRERCLLGMMSSDVERVWTYRHLHENAWHTTYLPSTSCLHSSVKRLRRKLEHDAIPLRIESVRGVGFRLARAI